MSESYATCALLSILLVVFLFVVYFFRDQLLYRSQISSGIIGKRVLITGCDTGFGNQAAKLLDSLGCHVIAGCMTEKGCAELKESCSSHLIPIKLDVTNEESVQQAFQKITSLLGAEEGLWGLVNNAGILGSLGPMEWLEVEDFARIMEVNVLGTVRVTRTFLPLLKKTKLGGRIVNTSSILGKLSIPYAAPYCMTKHAVEAFSDALRIELHPYDIQVSIIEPGGHSTKFLEGIAISTISTWDRLPEETKKSFGADYLKQVLFLGTKFIPFMCSTSLDGVVRAYQHALFAKSPLRRYLVGIDALLLSLSSFIPSAILDIGFNFPGFRAVPASCRGTR